MLKQPAFAENVFPFMIQSPNKAFGCSNNT